MEAVFDRLTDAVFALDSEWRFTYLNDQATRVLERSRAELLGENVWDAFPQATDSTFQHEYERAMETQEPVTFQEFYEPLEAWLEVRAYPSETGLTVYFRDITDRVERKERLRKREQALHDAYGVIADPERSFREQIDDLLGVARRTIGTEYATLSQGHEDAGEYIFEAVDAPADADLEAGDTTRLEATNCEHVVSTERTLVLENVDRDAPEFADRAGNAEWGISCYLGTPITVDGEVYGTFCFYDMEARAEAFTDWEVTFIELLGNWVSAELERERSQRELEKSNERLEQFAYTASHDLQEPLRMVTSYLDLIDRRYGDELDDDAEEFLEFAVDGAERMSAMIDGLLAYSRVETRGNPFEPVDLNAVLEDVRDDLQLRIEETDADISVASLPRVEVDPDQLRQVFQNLLGNALEYSGDEPPTVHVGAERAGGDWTVSVSDDGTGIGLALCRRIVERHGVRPNSERPGSTDERSESVGGEIRVESEPGGGATFLLTVPAVETAES